VSEGTTSSGPEDQELFKGLRQGLRDDSPLTLLFATSQLLTVTDPRRRDPFAAEQPRVELSELVDSFVGTDYAETTAALTVIQTLVSDDVLAARIGRLLQARRQPMPDWLAGLGQARITDVVELVEELGDGDDYLIGVRLPSGHELTALIYVDHNLGGVVKDAFVIDDSVQNVTGHMATLLEPTQRLGPTDPARARAIVTDAIDHGALLYPPITTETWPDVRPLVEWLVRQLPAGGAVPEPPEWTEGDLEQLRAEFFASWYGASVDDPDTRDLLDSLTWFGTTWGPGDPLRWSPVNVEMLLADWLPRKIVADPAYLSKAPDLLRAFVAWCHDRRGVSPRNRAETQASIDRWVPEYQRLIRTERPQGAEALTALMYDASVADARDDD